MTSTSPGFAFGGLRGNVIIPIACVRCGATIILWLYVAPLMAQDLVHNLTSYDTQTNMGPPRVGGDQYTIKSGNFGLMVAPSLELDWNDNINTTTSGGQQDFILQPFMQLTGTYKLTKRNVLTLALGIGYDEYLEHPIYNTLYLQSGSRLAFDFFVKDFEINVHDLAQYTQDTGSQAGVSGTAFFGGLFNSAGVTGNWNLHDLTVTLGCDYQTYISSSSLFEYLNSDTEAPVARAGFHLRPNLTAGLETAATFSTYSGDVLNNNQSYSAGAFSDWKPDKFFDISARAGYAIYDYDNTSQSSEVFMETPTGGVVGTPSDEAIRTADQGAWYAGLSITHQVTDKINYRVTVDHEIVPGVQSDADEVTRGGLTINWSIRKALSLQPTFNYEHGQQGVGNISGNVSETYNWLNGGLSANYAITTALLLRLGYRRSTRFSNLTGGSYGQDVVSLQLIYHFK